MSTGIEWATTRADTEYTEQRGYFSDAYGSENQGPAFAVMTGSNGWVIEAESPEAMIEWLRKCIAMVENYDDRGPRVEP